MNNILIVCEGVTDQIFIADCIEVFFKIQMFRKICKQNKEKVDITFDTNCRIVSIGGCKLLKNPLYLDMLRDNTAVGGVNIVIFDADFSPESTNDKKGNGNNGFVNANLSLSSIQRQHSLSFQHYLWHNNMEDGEVEHLLRQLIPQSKESLFKCISDHHTCLRDTLLEGIEIADIKRQLQYYLYTLQMKDSSKERHRDYKDATCWNLDHINIKDLQTFKTFLEKSMNLSD